MTKDAQHREDSPYVGRQAFATQRDEVSLGRRAVVEKLVGKVTETNFVALVGPSNAGRTSLVHAGLVPALAEGAIGGRIWDISWCRPLEDPLGALAQSLTQRMEPYLPPILARIVDGRRLAEELKSDPAFVVEFLVFLSKQHPDRTHLLLVVDRFEETFVRCKDEDLRESFIETLLRAAECDWVTILLILDAHFFGHVLTYPRLNQRVSEGQVNVLPMSEDEIRSAIVEPALRAGASFESGLVERIVADVAGAPSAPLFLQIVMRPLWELKTEQGMMTHAAYSALGGLPGVIARYADSVLERLTPEERSQARGLFTRLVWVSEAREGGRDSRRPAGLSELPDAALPLIGKLTVARLIVKGRDPMTNEMTVELAHDALVHGWQPLRDWVREDREFLYWRQHMHADMRRWTTTATYGSELWNGEQLVNGKRWRAVRPSDLTPAERSFVDGAIMHAEQRDAQPEPRRERKSEGELMTDDERAFDLGVIRDLLYAAFTYDTLRRFLQERRLFKPIITEFGPLYGLDNMVDEVIEYCETRLLWQEFLAEVEKDNPNQYARFASRLTLTEPE